MATSQLPLCYGADTERVREVAAYYLGADGRPEYITRGTAHEAALVARSGFRPVRPGPVVLEPSDLYFELDSWGACPTPARDTVYLCWPADELLSSAEFLTWYSAARS